MSIPRPSIDRMTASDPGRSAGGDQLRALCGDQSAEGTRGGGGRDGSLDRFARISTGGLAQDPEAEAASSPHTTPSQGGSLGGDLWSSTAGSGTSRLGSPPDVCGGLHCINCSSSSEENLDGENSIRRKPVQLSS